MAEERRREYEKGPVAGSDGYEKSLKEIICDITEQAYNGYILMNIIAAITIIAGMFFAFVREIKAKKCLMICLINAIASIILIIISSFAGNIAVMYYSCIAVDLFTFGYVAYIGIRHH